MGHCKKRHFLLSLCVVQLLTTLERQVFDFLGFMWAPILANFMNILFIIFGFFGTFQFVAKYIFSYAAWNLLWLAWNAFIICYYLNVGVLNRDSGILSLGTGSVSWWEANGWGCRAQWGGEGETGEAAAWLRPASVTGCMAHYSHIEAAHATLQCLLALTATILAFFHAATLSKADDDRSRGSVKSAGHQSLYSIEFSRPAELRAEPPTKPMTPRRVKRRSVSSRHSTRHSSRRTSQRRSASHTAPAAGHTNPTYHQSSQQSLNECYNDEELYNNRPASVRSSYSNFHGTRPINLHSDNTTIYPESSYNDTYISRPGSSPSLAEATPQVPQKRSVPDPNLMTFPYRAHSSQSAFLNNGPPAYHLHQGSQYFPPPPDSETAM